jgi:hypothetical protein
MHWVYCMHSDSVCGYVCLLFLSLPEDTIMPLSMPLSAPSVSASCRYHFESVLFLSFCSYVMNEYYVFGAPCR